MKRKFEMISPDLPQLRQMVLKNTERINRNEMAVDKLFLENAEQDLKNRERDEWWENSRREHERNMRDIEESLRLTAQLQSEGFQELKKMFAESDKEIKKRQEESDKRVEEFKKELEEETKKQLEERDKRLEKSLEERDKRLEKSLEERDKRLEKSLEERDKRLEKSLEESNKRLEKSLEESDKRVEECRKELDKRLAKSREETEALIRRVTVDFLGSTGHIVEGLASSAVDKIFQEAGLNLLHYGKNIKPQHPQANKMMEIDVLLGNEQYTVPIEVKVDFTKRKVKRLVRRMEMFRELFPGYANTEIVAAVAAINYADGADRLARDLGLLVIRVSSDNIFTLDPFDEKVLHRF